MSLKWSLPLCAILTLLLVASAASAQQVTGQVRYSDTNQPAFNVNVHCDGAGTSQIRQTDRSGRFTCALGSTGSFSVRVEAQGYLREEQSGTAVDTNAQEYLFFRLRPDPAAKTAAPTASPVDPNVPAEARKSFDKGVAAIGAGNKQSMEDGARHLEQAVSLYPKFLEAQVKLGAAYMDLQQWDKAELAFQKALEIDPKGSNTLFALGEIYFREKKNDQAEKILLEGLKIQDRSYQGHLALARVYFDMAVKLKDETQARPLLEKAYEQVNQSLKLNPNFAQAHLVKGNLLLRVRRAADAQREFEEYLRLDPKGPLADQTRSVVEKIKKALASDKKP
jgi:tetratricopeptide (TPR) repeat protein